MNRLLLAGALLLVLIAPGYSYINSINGGLDTLWYNDTLCLSNPIILNSWVDTAFSDTLRIMDEKLEGTASLTWRYLIIDDSTGIKLLIRYANEKTIWSDWHLIDSTDYDTTGTWNNHLDITSTFFDSYCYHQYALVVYSTSVTHIDTHCICVIMYLWTGKKIAIYP